LRVDGSSPFWDATGARFLPRALSTGSRRAPGAGAAGLGDLMPRLPFYGDLLADDARDVIGRPHPSAAPVYNDLRANGMVTLDHHDLTTAGPLLASRGFMASPSWPVPIAS
jgi:arginine N-succinyltransferase